MVLGILLSGVYFYNIKKRNDKINELNNYLALMCSGNFELDIMDNTEGEMSILKNNLYKIMTLLKTQNDELKKDKIHLANSLADISHQLKTPLTSMMVMTDLIKDEKGEDKRGEFINIIENQLDKMKWLITNLLKISKLDAGTTEFKHEKVSMKSVLNRSLKPFYVTCDIKQIEIINSAEDFDFIGDSSWTGEAIENIIKNCIEHTDKKGHLKFYCEKTNVFNSLFIEDDGCGIAPNDLPHIFERFYTGSAGMNCTETGSLRNNTHTENDTVQCGAQIPQLQSVGIGLALSRTIISKQNGTIKAENHRQGGAVFTIRLYKSAV